jgi:hypothetical protein
MTMAENEKLWLCPVCGLLGLRENPALGLHEICPCCGCQFGYDDAGTSWEQLRAQWIAGGARWYSRTRKQPIGWQPPTE